MSQTLETQAPQPTGLSDIEARLPDLLAQIKARGADAVELVLSRTQSLSIGVRKGAVETVERDETTDLGLRVMVGQCAAVVTVSEFSERTLNTLIDRALFMARLAPEDPYLGLADPSRLYDKTSNTHDGLELFDPSIVPIDALRDRALSCEAAGLAVDPRLQADGASAGTTTYDWRFLTSGGFSGRHRTSVHYQSARLIAMDENGSMERDGETRSKRFVADLPDPGETGRIAGQRAADALGARRIPTQTATVIFEPRAAKALLGSFLGAISGPSIARGSSFLKDRLGSALFPKAISIIDDPLRVRGLGSAHFDDEGVATERRALVEDGVLKTFLLNTAAALQLGMASTGHASRSLAGPPGVGVHNTFMMPGRFDQAGLRKVAGTGLVVTSMFGASLNADTGDWSAGVQGYWFEQGERAFPVNEITLAGNLIDMFARLEAGSDLELRGTRDMPSILIADLSVGGQ